jgi:peroxiredoxin
MSLHGSIARRRAGWWSAALLCLVIMSMAGGCGAPDPLAPATPTIPPIPRPPSGSPTPFEATVPPVKAPAIGLDVGQTAPDFTIRDVTGNTVRLSDLRGRGVLLNFWATWCPPCRAEIPYLIAAQEKYGAKGIVVIGIDFGESDDQVKRFAQENGMNFRLAMDDTGEVYQTYNVRGIPTTYFIDRNGVIVAKQSGGINPALIDRVLAKIL